MLLGHPTRGLEGDLGEGFGGGEQAPGPAARAVPGEVDGVHGDIVSANGDEGFRKIPDGGVAAVIVQTMKKQNSARVRGRTLDGASPTVERERTVGYTALSGRDLGDARTENAHARGGGHVCES